MENYLIKIVSRNKKYVVIQISKFAGHVHPDVVYELSYSIHKKRFFECTCPAFYRYKECKHQSMAEHFLQRCTSGNELKIHMEQICQ